MKIKEILDLGHHYLYEYCVIECATIIFFSICNAFVIKLYFDNLANIKEWDSIAIVAFSGSLVGVIKYCLESINHGSGSVE